MRIVEPQRDASPPAPSVRRRSARHHTRTHHRVAAARREHIAHQASGSRVTAPPAEAGRAAQPPAKTDNGTDDAAIREQVAVATALAERMTALGAPAPKPDGNDPAKPEPAKQEPGKPDQAKQDQPRQDRPDAQPADKARPATEAKTAAAGEEPRPNRLVAVVMVRPGVHSLADLRGKVIAIDERYVPSISKITAAMSAAGAPEVLLLEGQTTAISRLTNGEMTAAIVALVSPEAAEVFPQVSGYKFFRVALP